MNKHGDTREDGRIWDATLAYGGGWLRPEDFWRRAAGRPLTPIAPILASAMNH